MLIIIFSCCISFISLFILFFRPKNNTVISIPTWFLGSKNKSNYKRKLKLSKPNFFSFIIIILITFLAGYLFYPKNNIINKLENEKYLVIWIDPSLSAKLSRFQNSFSAENMARKLSSLSYNIYGLTNDFLINNGKPFAHYEIKRLDSAQKITQFILQEEQKSPSPFHQSIDISNVGKLLQNYPNFQQKNGTLIVYSDGKENSMLGVISLNKYFNSAQLIKSPAFNILPNNKQEFIPKNLANSWNVLYNNDETGFVYYDEKNGKIPEFARPHFYKVDYVFPLHTFTFIEDAQSKNTLPLIFACKDTLPSFIELDPFASLRTLVQFFNSTLIERNCKSETPQQMEVNNAMEFRKGAIWVQPLTKNILKSLNNDLTLWAPEGFNANSDALVYTAPFFTNKNEYIDKFVVQLDKSSFPIPLTLIMNPPISEFSFQYKEDKLFYKGRFKPIFKSENEIPLAWKLSSLPFFYLRTEVSSPNGELSRSTNWVKFWFEVAKNVKNLGSSYNSIELMDINKLSEEFENNNLPSNLSLSEILSLDNFRFQKPHDFKLGLYKTPDFNKLVLFKSSINSDEKNMGEEQFSSYFKNEDASQLLQNNESKASFMLYFAFVLICILLILLWSLKEKDMT